MSYTDEELDAITDRIEAIVKRCEGQSKEGLIDCLKTELGLDPDISLGIAELYHYVLADIMASPGKD